MAASASTPGIRMAVPSTVGAPESERVVQLQSYLTDALDRDVSVTVPSSYEQLAKELLSGKVDAAWAPPFVCARIEAMGVHIVARGIRRDASTYRAALVVRKDSNVTIDSLEGSRAAWSDRDSVGGYLLAMAFLRERGLNPTKLFFSQDFAGSYRSALDAVLRGQVDVTSVFAPVSSNTPGDPTGLTELWPDQADAFRTLAFTADAPNDGVAVSMNASVDITNDLERVLVAMHQRAQGQRVLADCFRADRFEVAPRMGYRSLYRVALASL